MILAALGGALGYYGPVGSDRRWIILLLLPILFFITLGRCPAWFWRNPLGIREIRTLTGCLAGLFFGCCLGLRAGNLEPVRLGLPETSVLGVQGILQDDPRSLRYGRGRGTLRLTAAVGPGGLRTSASGLVMLNFPEEAIPRLKTFGRGSEVYVECREFRVQGVHVLVPGPKLEQFRTDLRSKGTARFSGTPWGGLALALLLGVSEALEADLAASYRRAGCAHILALSGMHLAVLAGFLALLLKKPLGVKPAGVIGLVCIGFYVYLAGALPSLHRAAFMYSLGVLGVLTLLRLPPMSLLSGAFLIQLCLEPESGRSISFILSYLSLGGIVTVGEFLYGCFRGYIPDWILRPVTGSLGAFIITAPAGALFFGTLRPGGIIGGLIIAPGTMVFMLGALVFLAAGAYFPFIGDFLALMYAILEGMTALCGEVPGISARPGVVLGVVLGICGILGILKYFGRRKDYAPFAV